MTSLLRSRFAQTGTIYKAKPWQMASPARQSRDVCPLLPEHLDFATIKTHLSYGFQQNA
jgi:hypothetical protein